MISDNFDINDFVAKTQDSSLDDFIAISNQEATEAERYYLKSRNEATDENQKIDQYVKSIKALINCARYEIVPKNGVADMDVALLEQIKAKSHATL